MRITPVLQSILKEISMLEKQTNNFKNTFMTWKNHNVFDIVQMFERRVERLRDKLDIYEQIVEPHEIEAYSNAFDQLIKIVQTLRHCVDITAPKCNCSKCVASKSLN